MTSYVTLELSIPVEHEVGLEAPAIQAGAYALAQQLQAHLRANPSLLDTTLGSVDPENVWVALAGLTQWD
jgi:hypothetical protein